MEDGPKKRSDFLPPPGYFACKRALERLRKFQDLIRHREKWGHQIQFARPLEEIIGKPPPEKLPWIIEQEISRLTIPVWHDLTRLGVLTEISIMTDSDDFDEAVRGKQVRRNYDLITDYFLIPRGHGGGAHIFESTIRILDEGIGAYETLAKRARFHVFNPLMWCAWVLRAPVFVLHMAGIATGPDAGDKALRLALTYLAHLVWYHGFGVTGRSSGGMDATRW